VASCCEYGNETWGYASLTVLAAVKLGTAFFCYVYLIVETLLYYACCYLMTSSMSPLVDLWNTYLLNYLLTYLLTPWSKVLLEKLTGFAASLEIPRIYGTRKFITIQVPATSPYPEPAPSGSHNPLSLPEAQSFLRS
jgi:hypothetical protein